MIAGYVRLSKDDERQHSVSIEHQKLIISQYAAKHQIRVDRWYEDDGYSGYTFDRPAFRQMMQDSYSENMTILIKDFSRLGRHNAKVLLFLEECRQRGIRLIMVDDQYDSDCGDDDTIGIKTWYNERYVKDTSKKIRRALHARQQEGTLLIHLPYGYEKSPFGIRIVPEQADCVQTIYRLYLSGMGYRRIASYLNQKKTPTPSMCRYRHSLSAGKASSAHIAFQWSDHMVREILKNDFYTGTYRLHKRCRLTVHGSDRRVPADQQYVFPCRHPAIISKQTFEAVQKTTNSRIQSHFHGHASSLFQKNASAVQKYRGLLFCKECGRRLTPIRRSRSGHTYRYYICSTYNQKGKQFCAKSHLIHEEDLDRIVCSVLRQYRNLCKDELQKANVHPTLQPDSPIYEKEKQRLEKQLRLLLEEMLQLSAETNVKNQILLENYKTIEESLIEKIQICQNKVTKNYASIPTQAQTDPLHILDKILENGQLLPEDIIQIVDRITIDENRTVMIRLNEDLKREFH